MIIFGANASIKVQLVIISYEAFLVIFSIEFFLSNADYYLNVMSGIVALITADCNLYLYFSADLSTFFSTFVICLVRFLSFS